MTAKISKSTREALVMNWVASGRTRMPYHPCNTERDYEPDELEFMAAIEDFQHRSGKKFPLWSEVLLVIRTLGYVKVARHDRTAVAGEPDAACGAGIDAPGIAPACTAAG